MEAYKRGIKPDMNQIIDACWPREIIEIVDQCLDFNADNRPSCEHIAHVCEALFSSTGDVASYAPGVLGLEMCFAVEIIMQQAQEVPDFHNRFHVVVAHNAVHDSIAGRLFEHRVNQHSATEMTIVHGGGKRNPFTGHEHLIQHLQTNPLEGLLILTDLQSRRDAKSLLEFLRLIPTFFANQEHDPIVIVIHAQRSPPEQRETPDAETQKATANDQMDNSVVFESMQALLEMGVDDIIGLHERPTAPHW